MALSALDDRAREPDEAQAAAVLGEALGAWRELQAWLSAEAGVDRFEWGYSGKAWGWGLRAKAGKRAVLYMTPQRGTFLAGIVLGDRAVAAALACAALPERVREAVAGAKRYAEGTGLRLPVERPADLASVRELVRVKLGG